MRLDRAAVRPILWRFAEKRENRPIVMILTPDAADNGRRGRAPAINETLDSMLAACKLHKQFNTHNLQPLRPETRLKPPDQLNCGGPWRSGRSLDPGTLRQARLSMSSVSRFFR